MTLTKAQQKAFDGFEKTVETAYTKGKGRLKYAPVCDVVAFRSILEAVRTGDLKKAKKIFRDLDSSPQEEFPSAIYELLGYN